MRGLSLITMDMKIISMTVEILIQTSIMLLIGLQIHMMKFLLLSGFKCTKRTDQTSSFLIATS